MTQSGLADWLTRLESFSPHEIDLGLDRVREVLGRLELCLPERVLHVAGTNGKGSSVAMLQSMLMASGLRIGAYTSPHIVRYNERICVNGVPAPDPYIVAAFERIEALRGDIPLTYFEYGTIAALVVFEAEKVDVAVLEVGMGGRLDAVNAVEPTASLITNIALDHCDWLGNDIESIAYEKAGVMRPGRPTVFASTDLPATITRHADGIGANLYIAGRDYRWQAFDEGWRWQGLDTELSDLALPALNGSVQVQNAAGVLALLEVAGFSELLNPDTVSPALQQLSLAGRMQSVRGERHWLLDVAHNPAAAVSLSAALRATAFEGETIAIIGMLADKDVEGLVVPLSKVVSQWIAVQASSPRAISVDELARQVANATGCACLEAESIESAIEFAHEVSSVDDRILVTGSFYVVGPALEALGLYSRR